MASPQTKKTKSNTRTALLVVGMHRSGTSAATGVLSLLGVPVPGPLLGQAEENEKGFFENTRVLAFHERVLSSFDTAWDDASVIGPDWLDSPVGEALVEELRQLLRGEFGAQTIFAVKDPRLCRLVPLWIRALSLESIRPVAILPYRHPLEVAESLQKRNGFARAKSLVLWLSHILSAEQATRDLDRSLFNYNDLLVNWRQVTQKVSDDLRLRWPHDPRQVGDKIDEFLSGKLRHFSADPQALSATDGLHELTSKLYGAIQSLSAGQRNSELWGELDTIARRLHDAAEIFGPIVAWNQRSEVRLREQLGGQYSELQSELVRTREESNTQSDAAERELSNMREQLAQANERVQTLERSLHDTKAQFDSTLHDSKFQLAEAHRRAELDQATAVQLKGELDRAEQDAKARETQLSDLKATFETQKRDFEERLKIDRLEFQERLEVEKRRLAEAIGNHQAELGQMHLKHQAELGQMHLKHQAELGQMQLELADHAAKQLEMRQQLVVANRKLQKQGTRIEQKNSNLFTLITQSQELRRAVIAQREAYENSSSWRLTRPLRVLGHLAKGRWPHAEFAEKKKEQPELDDRSLVSLSSLFDPEFYKDRYHDVRDAGLNPLDHFLADGARENREPSLDFNAAKYLEHNPDVAQAKANPLLHYLRAGWAERRRADSARLDSPITVPIVPHGAWEQLRRIVPRPENPTIDIIIPVYGQVQETLNTIYSVLKARQKTPYELIVIDDASPGSDVRSALQVLEGMKLITLISNVSNLGFVATCNRGMSLHEDRDVVLLNSDTAVSNDWLDRLRNAAARNERIATVTPLSNNAEICGYPAFVKEHDTHLELNDADLDELAKEVNAGEVRDLPTGVGFCMYITRNALKDVGYFDEEQFNRGYGEENDFCQRAIKRGWRNVLAGDIFVRHFGGVSFGVEKAQRLKNALRALDQLHPTYQTSVREFIQSDPVRDLRARIDVARLKRGKGPRAMLFVTHERGGGTEHNVQQLIAGLALEDVSVFVLRASESNRGIFRLDNDGLDLPNLPEFRVPDDADALIDLLRDLNVFHMHVHQLVDAGPDAAEFIMTAAVALGVQYDVTLHDYLAICPRVTLMDNSNLYCGEPSVARCNTCVVEGGIDTGGRSVAEWREQFHRLLQSSRKIIVPSMDVRLRLSKYYRDLEFEVLTHPTQIEANGYADSHLGQPVRRIALIGALGIHKGSAVLESCAQAALSQGLNLEFIVFGYTDRDDSLNKLPNIRITGRYAESELQQLLFEYKCDSAWFISVWPETFSFTLTEALKANLFPIAFDLGAIAERVRAIGWGALLPIELASDPMSLTRALSQVRISAVPQTAFEGLNQSYGSYLADYYGLEGVVSAPRA